MLRQHARSQGPAWAGRTLPGPEQLSHASQRGQSLSGMAQPQMPRDSAVQDQGCYFPSHLSSVTIGREDVSPVA